MALESGKALERCREGLLALAGEPPAKRSERSWQGEAELALRRLYRLSAETAGFPAARPAFERWMDREVAGEENLAALARFSAGMAALRAGSGREEAERIWGPLAFLSLWQVVGPFENERGGGFEAVYGPEDDQKEAAAAGKLFLPDPRKSYPGKVRPVSFRKLPGSPVAGKVDLDALFRPNDEALAYALTYVESDQDQPAALRLGTDEGYRLWVNGALAGSHDVRRPVRFDQEAVGIRLEKGWNQLLLKVTEAKGSWGFQARLTRPDGGPLPGIREGTPPPGLPLHPKSGEPPRPSLGARDLLAARAGSADPAEVEPRDGYLLGALLLLTRAHDEGEHPDRELLRRAISMASAAAPAIFHHTLAGACLRPSAIAADRDDNDWREAMEAALAADPPSLRAALELAHHSLDTFGNLTRAQELVEKVLAGRPGLPEAVALRGRIEEQRRFPLARRRADDEIRRGLEEAAGAAGKLPATFDPQAVKRVAGRFAEEGRRDEARSLLEALLARDRLDEEARRILANLELDRGKADRALELWAERERLAPFEVEPRAERARILDGLDRGADQAAALKEALAIAPEDHQLLFEEGKLLRRLGKREDALRSWDRALAIQPNFPALREYLEFARRSRDDFAERYRRDLSASIKKALEEPLAGDDPVRVLLELTAVRVNPDGTVKEFHQRVARAMNDRGLRLLSRYSTAYEEGEQRVEFKAARVHHKGGATEEARLSVHGGGAGGGEGWTSASIDIPPLSVGEVVEVEHTTEDLRQSFFGDYFGRRETLREEFPVEERTFILEAPAARKLHFHQRNLELAPVVKSDDRAATVTYTWTLKDVEPERPEPGMPPREERAPLVEVSTFASWESFAHWYWNLIHRQLELSPPISAKVAELTSGKASEAEKIRAIYDFVTGEVRYNAWEFGVHGFKPYNAATIFQRRFGDCKDKATLLCTMLGAAGIRAHPVLIRAEHARGDEDLSMPMVNHFNHCIAYVDPAGGRGGLYLDGTAEKNAVDELPAMDRGAKVLVVREEGSGLSQVGWNRPEELEMVEEVQASLAADHSAQLKVRARARGDFAAHLRSFFEVPGRRRIELEKIYGARFAGSKVEGEEFSDLKDRSKPVEFQVSVRAPSFVAPSGEGEVVAGLDDFFETSQGFGRLAGLEARREDLVLGPPRRNELRAVYLLPMGYRVRSLPAASEVSGRFGKLTVRYQEGTEDGRARVVMTRVIETTAPRVQKADYPEFRELASAVARLRDEKLVIEKSP
jgi:tetratricopeptide (TPR) repeat protein